MSCTDSIVYDNPLEPTRTAHGTCSTDDREMPAERWLVTHQDRNAWPQGKDAQALHVLSLSRPYRPLLKPDDVPKVMQFVRRDLIAALDDLSVGTPEPDHPPIGRKGRERVESGGADMPPDRLQVLAGGAPNAQAKIGDELIDVSEHAMCRTVAA